MIGEQLGLFQNEPGMVDPVAPALVPSEVQETARALPSWLRLGTSSWTFPGWANVVYDRKVTPQVLTQHGLRAYARHPLLSCVGLDRTFYAPAPLADLQRYRRAVPETFRFVAKARDLCTSPWRAGPSDAPPAPNPAFLNSDVAADEVIAPLVEGLGSSLGVVLFQFTPGYRGERGSSRAFPDRLHDFLRRLPVVQGVQYAVELRHPDLLSPLYAEAVAAAGAVHCLNVHPAMAPLETQLEVAAPALERALVLRWVLRAGLSYEGAKERYAPFHQIVDPQPRLRASIAKVLEGGSATRPAYVVINNKAEGSAPQSLARLASRYVRVSRR